MLISCEAPEQMETEPPRAGGLPKGRDGLLIVVGPVGYSETREAERAATRSEAVVGIQSVTRQSTRQWRRVNLDEQNTDVWNDA